MNLVPYPSYALAELDWIEELPAGWTSAPIKTLASCNDDALPETTSEDTEIEYVDISSVHAVDGITATEPMRFGVAPSRARRLVKDGDVIVSTVRTYLRAIAKIQNPAEGLVVSTGFAVIRPRAVESAFLGHVLRSEPVIGEIIARSTGVSYPAINPGDLVSIKVPVPPEVDRRAIAAFLDRETAKIDTLIAEQRALIELLGEKRQSVLTTGMTKGLDPDVPMRDSGIPWIGDIPAHWSVIPLKKAIDFQEGPGIMAEDFRDEGVPLLRVGNVSASVAMLEGCNYLDPVKVETRWNHFKLSVGDLLISASASMGTVCEVGPDAEGSIAYTGIIRLREVSGISFKGFLRHFVVSYPYLAQIDTFKAGTAIQHYGPVHLRQMFFICPSVDEQKAIALHIDSELEAIDRLIAEAETSIALLQEHRSALITAVVTGKVDVREATA